MIGRLVQAADFQRLLAEPAWRRSAHFAVHHLAGVPAGPARPATMRVGRDLSTDSEPSCPEPVDRGPAGRWLGTLIPKRHARRAVTRSLLKRQVRSAVARHEEDLAPGLWLVRLNRPFEVAEFPSAQSLVLRTAVRAELDRLLSGPRR
jgi:ribonuclease P protein component